VGNLRSRRTGKRQTITKPREKIVDANEMLDIVKKEKKNWVTMQIDPEVVCINL
jgi:hypothetical protein